MAKIYSGSGRHFQEIRAVSLDHEGLGDIQQRIKLQPHFLGEPLIVIGETLDFGLEPSDSSYEILALDALGRTATISIVIGIADSASHLDSRAMQMAAHVATMNADELGKIALEFISRPINDSLRRNWDEMGVEMSDEAVELSSLLAASFSRDASDYAEQINADQRIIIAAEGFTASMVDVINWLERRGVAMQGLRYQKYLVGGQEIFFAEQVVPVIDPAVDSQYRTSTTHEVIEPWRAKGRQYHIDRLTPSVGGLLDALLSSTREETFAINWSNKYYFWLRGPRRTLRIRTYYRDKLEIGFHNITKAALGDFLSEWGLDHFETYTVGGYTDSPFLALTGESPWSPRIENMIKGWLTGDLPPADKPIL